MGPRVYGHRGSRRPGPDNTLAAIAGAFDAGADGVEIDVRRAADGARLVLAHDLPTGDEPSLAAALDLAAGRGRVICEVKNRPGQPDYDAPTCATAHLLVAMLAERGTVDDVVISSFDWYSLAAVRDSAGPPTAFITPPGVALRAAVAHAAEHGHREVHPHWTAVTARGLRRAHEAGLDVVTWPLTAASRIQRLARLGVDGLICDDPAAAVGAVRAAIGDGV